MLIKSFKWLQTTFCHYWTVQRRESNSTQSLRTKKLHHTVLHGTHLRRLGITHTFREGNLLVIQRLETSDLEHSMGSDPASKKHAVPGYRALCLHGFSVSLVKVIFKLFHVYYKKLLSTNKVFMNISQFSWERFTGGEQKRCGCLGEYSPINHSCFACLLWCHGNRAHPNNTCNISAKSANTDR